MAIQLQSPIAAPNRAEWLAQTAINSGDASDVIEATQQAYARAGAKTWHFEGPWETTEPVSYTQSNDLTGPDLDEMDAMSVVRRPDDAGDYQVRLAWWGYGEEVRLTAYRIDSDGTETQIDQTVYSDATESLQHKAFTVTLAAADTREGGLSGGNQAPIKYTVEAIFAQSGEETEAHIEAMKLFEVALAASDLP